jgi:hypothetical protein
MKIKNKYVLFFFVLLISINIFSEEVSEMYKSYLEINKDLSSLGFFHYDREEYCSHTLGFAYKKKIYTIDFSDNSNGNHLDAFGDFKYSINDKYMTIETWSSPSGTGRYIFVFKIKSKEPILIGTIKSIGEEFSQLGEFDGESKFVDYDNDDKEEILLYSINSGYVFLEIDNENLKIDYNKKNYEAINGKIKNQSQKKFNEKFLTGIINKKEMDKIIIINNKNDYILKKIGVIK